MIKLILALVSFIASLFRKDQPAPQLEIAASVDEPETSSSTVSFEEAAEFDTVGPAPEDHEKITVGELVKLDRGEFLGGWWTHARQFPINKGRTGGLIKPTCTVVHTTDMMPGTMAPLLKRWRDVAGEGAGAHFLIGKQAAGVGDAVPTGGIVQMVPITRNGNHAGGKPNHGWFKTTAGKLIHPNLVAVGIEIDNAGRLTKSGGAWIYKPTGKVFAPESVFVDDHGRGWEKITDYQFLALESLLDALDGVLGTFEVGVTVVPNGDYKNAGIAYYAAASSSREVGHCSLDPNRKTDPGPQIMARLNARATRS